MSGKVISQSTYGKGFYDKLEIMHILRIFLEIAKLRPLSQEPTFSFTNYRRRMWISLAGASVYLLSSEPISFFRSLFPPFFHSVRWHTQDIFQVRNILKFQLARFFQNMVKRAFLEERAKKFDPHVLTKYPPFFWTCQLFLWREMYES